MRVWSGGVRLIESSESLDTLVLGEEYSIE